MKEIMFYLDNDNGGRLATKAIRTVLPEHYHTEDLPLPVGKDYNDYLCLRSGLALTKRARKNERSFERWILTRNGGERLWIERQKEEIPARNETDTAHICWKKA